MKRLLLLALLLGCTTTASGPSAGGGKGGKDEGPAPTAEVVDACANHLVLLHKTRLARELARDGLGMLADPPPPPEELAASTKRLRELGIKGSDDAFSSASMFARLAQPPLGRADWLFLGWTPDLDDVGLAKIRSRRPGQWKQLWGKAIDYEVILVDGFRVPEYRKFFENATGHSEGGRDAARTRGKLIVIDSVFLDAAVKKTVADKKPVSAVLEKMSTEDVLKEVELREAGYLRFQDEAKTSSSLDLLVTWLEVLEGSPDLAFAGGAISAGDAPDELRRGGAVQAIILTLAAGDAREAGAEVLSLPVEERRKKLKELAPHFLRDGLGH